MSNKQKAFTWAGVLIGVVVIGIMIAVAWPRLRTQLPARWSAQVQDAAHNGEAGPCNLQDYEEACPVGYTGKIVHTVNVDCTGYGTVNTCIEQCPLKNSEEPCPQGYSGTIIRTVNADCTGFDTQDLCTKACMLEDYQEPCPAGYVGKITHKVKPDCKGYITQSFCDCEPSVKDDSMHKEGKMYGVNSAGCTVETTWSFKPYPDCYWESTENVFETKRVEPCVCGVRKTTVCNKAGEREVVAGQPCALTQAEKDTCSCQKKPESQRDCPLDSEGKQTRTVVCQNGSWQTGAWTGACCSAEEGGFCPAGR